MPQLSLEQRYKIAAYKDMDMGVTEISTRTGIPKCTVSRELRRNGNTGGYDAKRAQRLCEKRRKHGHFKICDGLLVRVDEMLQEQYSPEQISGRLALCHGIALSHECIYQFVYRDRRQGGERHQNLRLGRKKRRKRLGRPDNRGKIPNKTMIDQRPAHINERREYGHFEGDTVVGAGHQGVLVTLVERKSKLALIARADDKSAEAVKHQIVKLFEQSPIAAKSVTFDNGTEFALHEQIAAEANVHVYFAFPYHSWERGLNENTNGLIRQYFPKKKNLKELTDEQVCAVQNKLNNRPRKSLGFLTPIEFYYASIDGPPLVAFEP